MLSENGGHKSSFGYDCLGRAISTEMAEGADSDSLAYTALPTISVTEHYDAAHRLVALSDASDSRIAEQFKDPSGALARQLSRSIDALGRVQQTTGGLH